MVKFLSVFFIIITFNTAFSQNIIKTHAISLTDSIKYGADFKHYDYVNPNAPKGGTFRRALYGTYDSFNMFALKGVSMNGLGYIYDTLLTSSSDEAGTYYGLLAESIEYPDDYSWVIFNLRKNAYWHDGKPITSEDVVFSFNEITKVSPYYRNYYALIEKAEAVNKYRVKFIFKKGEKSRELPLIAGQLTIIPKHYWQTRDLSKATLEIPLGSGAYKITDYTAGKSVTLKRVPNYWGKDIPVNKEIESTKILKPYNGENITIANKFYEKDADEKTQQNSLIYYENIYMQNTGILYNSDKQFNVIAVLDGTVKNIKEDKILGNVIEIEHGTNLTAFYQSVDNIKVKVGDQVKQGDLIATSGANNIENTKDNCLHFQVYNQGQLLNPETFYTMNLNELS